MIGVAADDVLEARAVEELLGVVAQMEPDLGAASGFRLGRRRLDGEAAGAVRTPDPGLVGTGLAGDDLDGGGHHEGGVEADAELADEAGRAVAGGGLAHEGLGSRLGNGAEIVDQLVAAHADAVVYDRKGLGGPVRLEDDAQGSFALEQHRCGNGGITQPVAGIGRVGDQLAQKHLALGIDRVDHELEETGDLGLEGTGLGNTGRSSDAVGHGS
jgi:hypothetical protein